MGKLAQRTAGLASTLARERRSLASQQQRSLRLGLKRELPRQASRTAERPWLPQHAMPWRMQQQQGFSTLHETPYALREYTEATRTSRRRGEEDKALAVREEQVPVFSSTEEELRMTKHYLFRHLREIGERRAWQEVAPSLEEARSIGVTLDEPVCTAAMATLAKCRRWKEVLALRGTMRELGIEPSLYTYTSLVRALSAEGQHEEAAALFDAARQADTATPFLYTAMMGSLANRGLVQPCLELLDELRNKFGAEHLAAGYSSVMTAQLRTGANAEVLSLLDGMRREEVTPNEHCYSVAMQACARSRQTRRALELVGEMQREGRLDVRAYNNAILACGNEGDYKRALRMLRLMPTADMTPNIVSYFGVMRGCASKGLAREAVNLLKEIKRKGLRDEVWTYRIYFAALSACSRGGKSQEAKALLGQILDKHLCKTEEDVQRVYEIAIEACSWDGEYSQALTLLYQLKEKERARPTAKAVTSCMFACALAGQHNTALRLLDNMLKVGLEAPTVAFNAGIIGCGVAGDWKKAVALFHVTEERGLANGKTYAHTIRACVEAGQMDKAEELLSSMEHRRAEASGEEGEGKGTWAVPDDAFAPLLEALDAVDEGDAAEKVKVDELFARGLSIGCFGQVQRKEGLDIDLRGLNPAVARAAIRRAFAAFPPSALAAALQQEAGQEKEERDDLEGLSPEEGPSGEMWIRTGSAVRRARCVAEERMGADGLAATWGRGTRLGASQALLTQADVARYVRSVRPELGQGIRKKGQGQGQGQRWVINMFPHQTEPDTLVVRVAPGGKGAVPASNEG